MKTPYRVALIAAGVLCVCLLVYSFLPDRSPTMSPPPKADPVDEQAPADGGFTRIPVPTVAAVPAAAVPQPGGTDEPMPTTKSTEPAPKPTQSVDKKKPDTSASEDVEPTPEDDTTVSVVRLKFVETPKPPLPKAASAPKKRKDRTYTIKSGDTFAAIALITYGSERHAVAISQANPDVDPKRLQLGQVIRLPDVESAAPADATSPKLPDGSAYYVIRARDTLSRIAKRHYNDSRLWRVIYRANRTLIGPDPDRIQPGTRLVIPAPPKAGQDAR